MIVKRIFEGGIAVTERLKEGVFGGERGEIEWFAWREDDDLLGEIPVVGVV